MANTARRDTHPSPPMPDDHPEVTRIAASVAAILVKAPAARVADVIADHPNRDEIMRLLWVWHDGLERPWDPRWSDQPSAITRFGLPSDSKMGRLRAGLRRLDKVREAFVASLACVAQIQPEKVPAPWPQLSIVREA